MLGSSEKLKVFTGVMPFFYPWLVLPYTFTLLDTYFFILNLLVALWCLSISGLPGLLIRGMVWASVIVAVVSILVTGGMLTTGAFHSILLTSSSEIYGYFSLVYWPSMTGGIVMLVICGVWFLKGEGNEYFANHKGVLSASLIMMLVLLPVFKAIKDSDFVQTIGKDPVNLLYAFSDIPAYNLYRVATVSFRERYLSKEPYGTELPSHVDTASLVNLPEKIILILGESSRQDAYSLYGEKINSSPKLLSRYKASAPGHFARISKVFAPAPNTRESIPRSLSFSTVTGNLALGLPYKTIPAILSEQGYRTVWVTTQTLYTRWDTFTAKIATSSDRIVHSSADGTPWTDIKAAEAVLSELSQPGKQFVVLHLSGEHADYRIRNNELIPKENTDEIRRQASGKENIDDKKLNYLASVHLTDSIIDSIMDFVETKAENGLVIYFSDHGEVIGKGHGLLPIQLEAELSIPFVISGRYSGKMEKIIDAYRDEEYNIFNTDFFPEVLIQTLGGEVIVPEEASTLTYFSIEGFPQTVKDERERYYASKL
ncbi:sulfatase-like hydrolase/transferase [Parasalinivibrio latis]|uniref:sulfatase-like hydrolase/transferase n=1 Tax=Parasalinivibrio latis TaxID=2952610 RepID=UPI0030E12AD3